MTTRTKQLKCYTCGQEWTTDDPGRDEYCDSCFNPHNSSGKVIGCQTNIPTRVIPHPYFAQMLDKAMDMEIARATRKNQ